ncbi:MAG: hypothetical protein ABIG71_00345 [Candidatus Uhrbacteria bacterium]
MQKEQFIKQIQRVLMIPGVCPKEQRSVIVEKLESMSEDEIAALVNMMNKLPKEEVMAAMQSGDHEKMQQLIQDSTQNN